MISLPPGTRIWLVAGVTDMRKSFNGLGELVQHALKRSADGQDRRCNRRNDEADAEILSVILDIISDMPSYGLGHSA